MSKFDENNPGKEASAKETSAELRVAALKYNKEKDRAPRVVAAGSGDIARRILQVAIENGIAVYHDDSAATLLAKLELGQEIPSELYQIVVNIYIALLDTAEAEQSPL